VINQRDKEGATCLYRAAAKGYEDIVNLLLDYNANPNIELNESSYTPLFSACYRGHYSTVKLLLEHEKSRKIININHSDIRGRTSIMVAISENHASIVNLLLTQQISPPNLNVLDKQNYGWNCLHWAIYRNNEEIAKKLINSNLPINYWHLSSFGDSILDIGNRKLQASKVRGSGTSLKGLSETLRNLLMNKFNEILSQAFYECDEIIKLNIPTSVIKLLITFAY